MSETRHFRWSKVLKEQLVWSSWFKWLQKCIHPVPLLMAGVHYFISKRSTRATKCHPGVKMHGQFFIMLCSDHQLCCPSEIFSRKNVKELLVTAPVVIWVVASKQGMNKLSCDSFLSHTLQVIVQVGRAFCVVDALWPPGCPCGTQWLCKVEKKEKNLWCFQGVFIVSLHHSHAISCTIRKTGLQCPLFGKGFAFNCSMFGVFTSYLLLSWR